MELLDIYDDNGNKTGRVIERGKNMTNAKDYLGKIVTVEIDRALGTKHPKHGFIYTVNYGYIEGTISGDGEELDAYVLGVFEPCKEFTGRVISYIHRTNDNDDKLIIGDHVFF